MTSPSEFELHPINFVCKQGCLHTDSPGSTGLLVAQKRRSADGELEIIVRLKHNLLYPEPPKWHALPIAQRLRGEAPDACAMRAADIEMGLGRESFHFRDQDIRQVQGCVSVVLATPAKKMGPCVGHYEESLYTWVPVSEIIELEVGEGCKIGNSDLRALLELLPPPKTRGIMQKLKRALTSGERMRKRRVELVSIDR
ncbi:hypothetical protein GGS21DRAFT_493723 [Xylaria nigripes]|nr:hypothetical protein GGS21DRAFT_493723 [Xylaria nigripes]